MLYDMCHTQGVTFVVSVTPLYAVLVALWNKRIDRCTKRTKNLNFHVSDHSVKTVVWAKLFLTLWLLRSSSESSGTEDITPGHHLSPRPLPCVIAGARSVLIRKPCRETVHLFAV